MRNSALVVAAFVAVLATAPAFAEDTAAPAMSPTASSAAMSPAAKEAAMPEHHPISKEAREEMEKLKAEHASIKAEKEKLMAECKENASADKGDCKTRRDALMAKKKDLHDRVTALRAKEGLPPRPEHMKGEKHGGQFGKIEGGAVPGVPPSAAPDGQPR